MLVIEINQCNSLTKVKQRLEDMSKAEGRALKALKSYSDDPNVDGGGPADPGAD